jgi:hypothetical protein
MKRQLVDRIETYLEIIPGQCTCGEKVNKVINSNCTSMSNGNRYYYPEDNSAWCIFRCRNCEKLIDETFINYKNNVIK